MNSKLSEEIPMERTLLLIKPDGMQFREAIMKRVQDAGFFVLQQRTIRLTPDQSSEFYKNRNSDPSFALTVMALTEGPIQAICLTKQNAVSDLKFMTGPEIYANAKVTYPNGLRAIFADNQDQLKNAVHVSESPTDAQYEIHFFFPNMILEPIHARKDINCYLQGSVNVTLMDGLFELAKERPNEPILWLANYLLENNPFKPTISEPTAKSLEKIKELEGKLQAEHAKK